MGRLLPAYQQPVMGLAAGTLAIDHGGTGATTAAGARANLGITAAGPATAIAGETLAAGDVIYLYASGGGNAGRAYKASVSLANAAVVGIVTAGGAMGATVEYVLSGPAVSVRFASVPAATQNGYAVWLSSSAGYATTVVPLIAYVRLGFLVGADGVTTTPEIQFIPQLMSA